MAKNNRPGTQSDSGIVRRTLAAASLLTALAGGANAQGNKSPDMPEADAAKVMETVKDKTGVQLANELGLGFSDEDLRKINESGNTFSHKGTGYSSKTEPKPVFFEQLPPAAQPQNGMQAVRPVPQLQFTTGNNDRIGTMFDPSSGQAGASYEKNDSWRTDFGLVKSIGTVKDTRVKASFQVLYAASQLGTYVGIEKGSELSKFVVAQGFKVEGGKLQVTAALLKRLVEVNFSEVGVIAKPELTQKAIGVDYTRGFSKESILQELKTSVVYYDVDGKNLGTIGHIIVDNATTFDQTRVDGGVRGGKKFLAEVAAAIKITEKIRADVSLGAETIRYDQMFDTAASSKTGMTGGLGLTYQPTQYDKISVKGRASVTGTSVDLRYEHDFGNGVSGFVEAGRTAYSTGIMPETRVMAGVNIALDGKGRGTKAISPLFNDWKDRTKLTLQDLNPNPLVATDTIQVMERVIYKEHEIRIDKTVLPGTSFLEKNADGTLKALDIDTGANNLVSVSASNLSAPYSGYLSVSGGRYLRIANLKDFAKIAPITVNASLADSVGTFTLVSVGVQKGSSVIASVIERANGVSAADAAAFVAGTKTIAQIIAGAANTAPTLSDVVGQTVNEDGSVTVNVTVGDAQTPLAALALTASSNNNALFPNGSIVFGGSGANRTITLTPAANAFGTAIVSYAVTDGGGLSVTKSFSVTVNSVDDAPVFSAVQSALSLTQNAAMTNVTAPLATDADSPSLTYSMTGLPTGVAFNPATRVISGTPTVTGTFTVTYSVFDGTSTVTQSFQTVVAAAHVPPVMGDVPNQTGSTGTAFSLNLSGYVTATNGDAILGYGVASGSLPPGLTLNTATGAVTGTPTTAGTYAISVLAFDTDGNSNPDSVAFSIADATAPNLPTVTAGFPSITSANSVSVEVNGEIGSTVWINGANSWVTIGGTGKANVNLDTSGTDGLKSFSVTLKDASNNQSLAATVSITADRTAPTTVSASASGVADTAATVSFTVNETSTGYYVVLPSASPAPSAASVISSGTPLSLSANSAQSVSLSGLSQTTSYVVYFAAKDALNNAQASVSTVPFTTLATPDTTPPTNPTITAGYASSTSANSVSVEVNGEIGATVWVNGSNTGSVVGVGGKVTINLDTSGADGVKNFSITLKDASNNQSGAATVSITKDATGPSMSAVGYSTTSSTAGAVVATVTTSENLNAPSGWTKSGSGPYSFAKSYSTNTTESVVFSDSLGNNTTVNVSVTNIDTVAPTTLSMPSSAVTQNSAAVTFTVSESGTGYYVIQPAANPAPNAASVMSGSSVALTANSGQAVLFTSLSPSTAYTVYFVAKDSLGNAQATPGSVSFTTQALPNTAPSLVSSPTNQTVGKNAVASTTFTVDDTESGAASVAVTATSSNQSLVKDSNVVVTAGAGGSRTITVTPEAGVTGSVTINYQLSDGTLSTTGSFTVTFTNSAPVISSTVSNQSYVQGTAITALTLPVANDSNVGDTVTYSVSGLPSGLSFNSGTRQITGAPSVAPGTYAVTYTATDGSNATDSKTFDIVVSANAAPSINSTPTILQKPLNFTQSGLVLAVSDTGPLSVEIAVDNGGAISVTNASGWSVSGNGSSSVIITGATSGSVVFSYTSPSSDSGGFGGEGISYSVTDSGGLNTSTGDFIQYSLP